MVYNAHMEDYINKLKDNPAFLQFEEYIMEKIDELDHVADLERLSNEAAGEEAKVRLKSRDKLLEILSPFLNLVEKKEPTAEQVSKAKEKNLL